MELNRGYKFEEAFFFLLGRPGAEPSGVALQQHRVCGGVVRLDGRCSAVWRGFGGLGRDGRRHMIQVTSSKLVWVNWGALGNETEVR